MWLPCSVRQQPLVQDNGSEHVTESVVPAKCFPVSGAAMIQLLTISNLHFRYKASTSAHRSRCLRLESTWTFWAWVYISVEASHRGRKRVIPKQCSTCYSDRAVSAIVQCQERFAAEVLSDVPFRKFRCGDSPATLWWLARRSRLRGLYMGVYNAMEAGQVADRARSSL